MDTAWKTMVRQQLGAAVDMLENALVACPDELWDEDGPPKPFWYLAYHTLFFLDLYAGESVEGFAPPAPFTLSELDPSGVMPERTYSKDELLGYLAYGRQRVKDAFVALTDEQGRRRVAFDWLDASVAELFLYNLRHVQHHAAQLNLILRQRTGSAPGWVFTASGAEA